MGVFDMPIDVFKLMLSTLGVDEFKKEILAECGPTPRFQYENVQVRRDQRPEERETLDKWNQRKLGYDKCANQVAFRESKKKEAEKLRLKQSKKSLKNKMSEIRKKCQKTHKHLGHPRSGTKRAKVKKNMLFACTLKLARADNCLDCIRILQDRKISVFEHLYKMFEEDYPLYSRSALKCYNTQTQSELFCKTAASAVGGVYALAKVAKKIGPSTKDFISKKVSGASGASSNISPTSMSRDTLKPYMDINEGLQSRQFAFEAGYEFAQKNLGHVLENGNGAVLFHGSTSNSLIAFTSYKKLGGLRPTGVMRKNGFEPRSGELGPGVSSRGVNQQFLSTVKITDLDVAADYTFSFSQGVSEFPVLYGLKPGLSRTVETFKADMGRFASIEVGLKGGADFSEITSIFVPKDKVAQVRKMLKKAKMSHIHVAEIEPIQAVYR